MPNWKKVIVSGSDATFNQVAIAGVEEGTIEDKVLVLNSEGLLLYRDDLSLQGPTGTQGTTGQKGQKGEIGVQGISGTKGQKGEIGVQGTQGIKGT